MEEEKELFKSFTSEQFRTLVVYIYTCYTYFKSVQSIGLNL